jgi:hypothetical protein
MDFESRISTANGTTKHMREQAEPMGSCFTFLSVSSEDLPWLADEAITFVICHCITSQARQAGNPAS